MVSRRLNYLDNNNNKKAWVLDLEANDLKATQIWVVVVKNLASGEVLSFIDRQTFNEWLSEEKPVLIGHNIISFDVPVLNRLWGCEIDLTSIIDTLVLSRLYNPNLKDGHSLDAWGKRLGVPKGNFSDWSQYSKEMHEYCIQDCNVTSELYKQLTNKMRRIGFSEKSCEIEHGIRIIIDQQEANGFFFDKDGATKLCGELRHLQHTLAEQIQKLFPPTLTFVKRCVFRRLKNGNAPARYEEARNKYDFVETNEKEGWYDCYEYRPFNLGSPKQRVDRLLALGWKPDKFTKTKSEDYPQGFPQVNEESLIKLSEGEQLPEEYRPQVKALAEWLVLQGRSSMIENWLKYVGPDSRIHGRVNSCGASTRRMTHSSPNSSNIPSGAKSKYGHECRALWKVEPNKGYIQVGVDASGLENVGLLHYLNNPKATEILLRPKPNDVHTANSRALTKALGFEVDREWGAKTCVPLDTKILTRRGWKSYDELIIGEEVLGYNQETELKEWTRLLGIHQGEDEVIEISNSYRKFRATRNHRWFVKQRRMGSKSWSRVHGRYMENQVRTTEELNTESSIIMNAPFNTQQDNSSSVKTIDGKYDVDWEQKILDMSHSERVQWLQGFMLADGHIPKTSPKSWHWSQNVGNIAEAALLCSYLVHDGQINVSEKENRFHKIWTASLNAKSHITGMKLVKNSLGIQKVWCPQTELGSWVMRQGREITITGNCFFALIFGAGDAKLGSIVKKGPKEGKIIRETIIKNIPGFDRLLKDVEDEFYRTNGLLQTVDGGFVHCECLNAALNYKVQSAGAIVMKYACMILHQKAKRLGLWFELMGTIHDEFQMCCKEEDGERLGKLAVFSIERAAEELGFNVALTGEYKLGKDWGECH